MNLKRILPREFSRKIRMKLSFLPDKIYIGLFYFIATGRFPNLRNPTLFSEKQQWLKLHDIHPEYKNLVDKLEVNKYVDSCIGEGHCFPILGAWSSFEDINFDELPNQFVLKCNHDSGSTKVMLAPG